MSWFGLASTSAPAASYESTSSTPLCAFVRRTRSTVERTTSSIFTRWRSSVFSPAKSSNARTISLISRPVSRISSSRWRAREPSSDSLRRNSVRPRIANSGLLISCATPAASSPIAVSFPLCTSCWSSCRRSVRSVIDAEEQPVRESVRRDFDDERTAVLAPVDPRDHGARRETDACVVVAAPPRERRRRCRRSRRARGRSGRGTRGSPPAPGGRSPGRRGRGSAASRTARRAGSRRDRMGGGWECRGGPQGLRTVIGSDRLGHPPPKRGSCAQAS